MKKLKTWDEISTEDGELYSRRDSVIRTVVNDFYQKVKSKSNVLSAEDVYKLCDKFSFFGNSVWYDKIPFKSQFRKDLPVIFGLKTGIVFQRDEVHFLNGNNSGDYWSLSILWISSELKFDGNKIYDPRYSSDQKVSNQDDIQILKDFMNLLNEIKIKFNNDVESDFLESQNQKNLQINILKQKKKIELTNFDKDSDGKIDLIENDFNKLLNKNQKNILLFDKSYIHQFVKVSNYIKTKQQNTQKIFESIRDTSTEFELEERVSLLKNQIHAYELLVFHSINLIGALVSEDLISFYEIYESFDKLGMFNSNWENEVSEKLTNIGDKLDDLMYSIYNMEQNIVSELSQLSYITQESFENLNSSVSNQLREIESSINTNNLLTGIQTYQLYKINKNTKSLRG
jgi:hypothetical protein